MKKFISIISAAAVILTITGCSSSENTVTNNVDSSTVSASDAPSASGGSTGSTGSTGTAGTAGSTGSESSSGELPTYTASSTGSTGSAGTTGAETDKSEASKPELADDTAASIAGEPSETESTGHEAGEPDTGGLIVSSETGMDEVASTSATTVPSSGAIVREEALEEVDGLYDAAADIEFEGGISGCIEPPTCTGVPPVAPITQPEPQAGMLTGGEWNDNDHWNDWVSLYQKRDDWSSFDEEWGFSLNFRYEVKVTSGGQPIEGAKVTCETAFNSAVTDNTGTAYLFFDDKEMLKQPMNLTVTYGDISVTQEQLSQKDSTVDVELDGASADRTKKLDLMIMCDTTGSMYDELAYLQTELADILKSVEKNNENLPTRVSVNFYRDEGDDYVVRDFAFTTDFAEATEQIRAQAADGGGDFPEAVHTALENALKNHDWDEDAVKLMFVVLDAPPHSNDPQIVSYVRQLTALAAEMGVRIIPIASSGIDKTTEFLLRNMAFVTGGTYTFLTDDSGISVGGHIEPTIGDYTVERLNDMIVRIVSEYLQ